MKITCFFFSQTDVFVSSTKTRRRKMACRLVVDLFVANKCIGLPRLWMSASFVRSSISLQIESLPLEKSSRQITIKTRACGQQRYQSDTACMHVCMYKKNKKRHLHRFVRTLYKMRKPHCRQRMGSPPLIMVRVPQSPHRYSTPPRAMGKEDVAPNDVVAPALPGVLMMMVIVNLVLDWLICLVTTKRNRSETDRKSKDY